MALEIFPANNNRTCYATSTFIAIADPTRHREERTCSTLQFLLFPGWEPGTTIPWALNQFSSKP